MIGSSLSPSMLPLVLAGPIVRRATANSVWFWIVFSKEPTKLQPHIIPYNDAGHTEYTLTEGLIEFSVRSANPIVIRLGDNIWVSLCEAIPLPGKLFPTDSILGYDLDITYEVEGSSNTTKLSDELELGYNPFPLPTFVIGKLNTTLVHGSCRRPGSGNDIETHHGGDAFFTFDKWMSTIASKVLERPASLILTGDQIYADDVALPLFKGLHDLAYDVFGYVEQLPNYDKNKQGFVSVDDISWQKGPNEGSGRKTLTNLESSKIGFTTDDGENHLLSFPEYASMYLIVWNPELCKDYNVDTSSGTLKDYSMSVKACRRVMANCSTYMLFDDHDVTDDWNLDEIWVNKTKGNNMSRRIIGNALAAYWCFQAWGNDPHMFDQNFMDTIPKELKSKWKKGDFMAIVPAHLEYMRMNEGLPEVDAHFYDDILLDMHWSFMAASNPKALCVDTRTSREFPTVDLSIPKQDPKGKTVILSGYKVWPFLSNLLQKNGFQQGDILLMVLPTPFLPYPTYIKGMKTYDYPSKRYEGDYENYGTNTQQRADLIRYLKLNHEPSAIIIFSGDVHFGSVVLGKYGYGDDYSEVWRKGGIKDWELPIVQITSSPIKNVNKHFTNKHYLALWMTDIANIGSMITPFSSREHASYSDSGTKYIGSQSVVGILEGELNKNPNRPTYIYQNNFCVVNMKYKNTSVKSVFVGALVEYGDYKTSERTVDLSKDVFDGLHIPEPPYSGMGAGSRASSPDPNR